MYWLLNWVASMGHMGLTPVNTFLSELRRFDANLWAQLGCQLYNTRMDFTLNLTWNKHLTQIDSTIKIWKTGYSSNGINMSAILIYIYIIIKPSFEAVKFLGSSYFLQVEFQKFVFCQEVFVVLRMTYGCYSLFLCFQLIGNYCWTVYNGHLI